MLSRTLYIVALVTLVCGDLLMVSVGVTNPLDKLQLFAWAIAYGCLLVASEHFR